MIYHQIGQLQSWYCYPSKEGNFLNATVFEIFIFLNTKKMESFFAKNFEEQKNEWLKWQKATQ